MSSKRLSEYEKIKSQYKKNNPPDHSGYHYCHYGGGAIDYFTVEHKNGRQGALLTDLNNWVVSCNYHNSLKGSKKYKVFKKFLINNPQYRVCQF